MLVAKWFTLLDKLKGFFFFSVSFCVLVSILIIFFFFCSVLTIWCFVPFFFFFWLPLSRNFGAKKKPLAISHNAVFIHKSYYYLNRDVLEYFTSDLNVKAIRSEQCFWYWVHMDTTTTTIDAPPPRLTGVRPWPLKC